MAAALGTYSSVTVTKPKRIEGHTSNVETPVLYSQYGKVTIAETTEAGDTYILPHKLSEVLHINLTPISATGKTALYGNGTTEGAFVADSGTAVAWTALTTAQTAGASTLVLTSGSAIDDVYNNCWLDIRFSNGNLQTVKITDYVGSTTTATLAEGLAQAVGASGAYYRIRGTVLTIASAAATPALSFEVVGYFEG